MGSTSNLLVGCRSASIDSSLKCFIQYYGAPANSKTVCAILQEGFTKDLHSQWESPFGEDTVGSYFQKIGGLIQSQSGVITKTQLNTQMVWSGNEPLSFQLPLVFFAQEDPQSEVMDAVLELQKMASPELNENIPLGVSKSVMNGHEPMDA